MNCRNCGAQINDNSSFCPVCGAQVAQTHYQYNQYDYNNQNVNYYTQNNEEVNSSATKALVFGILSLAMSDTCLPFLGIIFASIANKHVKTYESYMGEATGKAKVGKIFAKIGKILGIVLTIVLAVSVFIYLLYFIIYGAALSTIFFSY